jgi:molybdate transport system substrate-binding protein
MRNKLLLLLIVLVLIPALSGCGDKDKPEGKPVRIYAGAGLKPSLDKLIASFEKKTGISVEPDYGGSGMVLSRAQLDTDADLFMPGDVWYVDRLHEKNRSVTERVQVTWFVPVIITAPGNPRKIAGLKDFFRDDVEVAVGNPDKGPQIGRLCVKLFEKNQLDFKNLRDPRLSTTVNELGTWVAMNSVDVSVVWDATANNLGQKVTIVEIPKENNIISHVVVGLLNTSKQPDRAKQFIDFMTGTDGRAILKEKGFRVDAP